MPPAQTIDEVIQALTVIIQICGDEKSRLGYFPALYRRVTERVKAAIAAGQFEDGARMERLDVVFANRYLAAWDDWRAGRPVTASWRVAFEAGSRWRPVILQHLLSGMNAHINLDLAIAAATVCPGAQIQSLEGDFNQINQVLAELVDPVETELAEVSPWIGLVKAFGGHAEGRVVNFGIRAARDLAWTNALQLAALQGDEHESERRLAIEEMDAVVEALGRLIVSPGPLLQTGLLLVRAREESDAVKVIAALARPDGRT
ncbi:MAG: DUF5995 family protein [Bryobacteraceae bacterium]|nr:DUF5995 family protein [Bryobacteraceae bacterium]